MRQLQQGLLPVKRLWRQRTNAEADEAFLNEDEFMEDDDLLDEEDYLEDDDLLDGEDYLEDEELPDDEEQLDGDLDDDITILDLDDDK